MQKILISSILIAGFTSPLFGDDSQHIAPENLQEMVVTATRTETARNQLSAASTVYTRHDIERLQVKSLPELLKGTTGIDMTMSGGLGHTTSVFMRGTNSDHVLVMIDGIKIGSATLGTSPFEFVPIDQVERVEIIRGPQSSLYGSEAIGGVIQIFTRKGGDTESPSYSLNAGAGSYDTYRAAGNVNGKWQNSWYGLGVSTIGSEGINARQPTSGFFGFSQPDRDGYENTAINARAGHRFANNAELEASFIRTDGNVEYDATFVGDHSDFVTQTIALSGNMDITPIWHSTLRLGQSVDENDTFFPNNTFDSRFNSTRWNASWLNELTVTDEHKIILGTDYRLDEVESTTQYAVTSRYDVGIFGEYHGQFFDNQFLNASVRWDENEQFGDYATGSVGWRANWDYGISSFANFGNAFKAPSFNELYFPNFGNRALGPEQSTSFEVGFAGNHDWLQWELRAYHTEIDDLITPIEITTLTPELAAQNYKIGDFTAVNIGKAQIEGLEAEVGTQWLGWNAKLNMSLLNPEAEETHKRLPRRTDKSLSFDLSRSFGNIDVGSTVIAQDYRYDDPENKIKVAGFVTVDLRTAYHINQHWELSAKLNNLLDENYQTVNTFNQQGRNFFFTIHYNN